MQGSSERRKHPEMTMLILSAGAVCAIAFLLHVSSILVVIRRVRVAGTTAPEPKDIGGVTIVRPVCGVENFAEETLASAFRLDCPRYEILFCAAHSGMTQFHCAPPDRRASRSSGPSPCRQRSHQQQSQAQQHRQGLARGAQSARAHLLVGVAMGQAEGEERGQLHRRVRACPCERGATQTRA